MGRRSFIQHGTALLVTAALSLSCSSSHWKTKAKSPTYQPPTKVFIFVELAPELNDARDGGGIATMVEHLELRLHQRGIEAVEIDKPGPSTFPLLYLLIRSSSSGIRTLNHFTGFGAANISLDCQLLTSPGIATFTGTINGSDLAVSSSEENLAAESAGITIANTIASPP